MSEQPTGQFLQIKKKQSANLNITVKQVALLYHTSDAPG
jgi:hypothetical protein